MNWSIALIPMRLHLTWKSHELVSVRLCSFVSHKRHSSVTCSMVINAADFWLRIPCVPLVHFWLSLDWILYCVIVHASLYIPCCLIKLIMIKKISLVRCVIYCFGVLNQTIFMHLRTASEAALIFWFSAIFPYTVHLCGPWFESCHVN